MSAIGCHVHHLACFVAGLAVARVAADVGALMPGRKVVDYASALLEFEGGARGTFTVTQAAAGGENDIRLRVYGDKGMLEWSHRDLSYLRLALHRRAGAHHRPRRSVPAARDHRPRAHAARTSGGIARGLREHLRRSRAGADCAHARRDGARPAVSAHRGGRAHDGVHRGVHRVAARPAAGSTWRRCRGLRDCTSQSLPSRCSDTTASPRSTRFRSRAGAASRGP